MSGRHIVALSGGKDSTAMALRLVEVEPRNYEFVCTPTGNELPEMLLHWERLGVLLGKPLQVLNGQTLEGLIQLQNALPNVWMRWCTRMLKLEPFIKHVKANLPCTVYVGLRADEAAERDGFQYDFDGVTTDYPFQRWGWDLNYVLDYLQERSINVPERTDCAWCFFQTLYEWFQLWKEHPDLYWRAAEWEAKVGHTLRSPARDTRPAALKDLAAEFASGYMPKPKKMRDRKQMCAVCAR